MLLNRKEALMLQMAHSLMLGLPPPTPKLYYLNPKRKKLVLHLNLNQILLMFKISMYTHQRNYPVCLPECQKQALIYYPNKNL